MDTKIAPGGTRSGADRRAALERAADWLTKAHDATGRAGFSAGYDLREGWLPTYPEISGYLVPTMLRLAAALGRPGLGERAREVGAWLPSLHRSDGSFPGGTGTEGAPVVFDVGQIVLGLVALYRETGDETTWRAAVRGADWLCSVLRPDGAWLSHFDAPNTYSSRVTWAVAEVWRIGREAAHLAAVEKSVRWLLGRVRLDGWIEDMRFSGEHTAWTHKIGYCLRGMLRAGNLLGAALGDPAQQCALAAATCAGHLADLRTDLHPLRH